MRNLKLFLLLLAMAVVSSNAYAKLKGFVGNIDDLTIENKNFRKVIYTASSLQLVLMTLKPGEDIGEEVHQKTAQFFRVESGRGQVVINGMKRDIIEDDAVLVPEGATHNVINTGKKPLQIYTLYAPPEHKDKTIHRTKADAKAEHFDGKTTE